MPNRVKRIGKRIKELSKNPGYVITQGAKFVNSMYDTLPMEVAMKKGGMIIKKGKPIREIDTIKSPKNRIKPDSVKIKRRPPRSLKKGKRYDK
jgi:hypothetical protein